MSDEKIKTGFFKKLFKSKEEKVIEKIRKKKAEIEDIKKENDIKIKKIEEEMRTMTKFVLKDGKIGPAVKKVEEILIQAPLNNSIRSTFEQQNNSIRNPPQLDELEQREEKDIFSELETLKANARQPQQQNTLTQKAYEEQMLLKAQMEREKQTMMQQAQMQQMELERQEYERQLEEQAYLRQQATLRQSAIAQNQVEEQEEQLITLNIMTVGNEFQINIPASKLAEHYNGLILAMENGSLYQLGKRVINGKNLVYFDY